MCDDEDDILAGIQGAGKDDDEILIISTEDEDDETMNTFLDYVLGTDDDED